MPILYGLVARGSTVLAKHATCAGNFAEVSEGVIKKVAGHDEKMTYTHGNYLFHYICESGIIYLCISDEVST